MLVMLNNKITVSSKLSSLSEVRGFVADYLAELHVSENDANMIVLSVDEICANLILHAGNNGLEDDIEIEINKINDSIKVTILDHCLSFNPIQSKNNTIDYLVKEKKKGGIGLLLVNKIMDKIEYKIESNYNICNLYKFVTTV